MYVQSGKSHTGVWFAYAMLYVACGGPNGSVGKNININTLHVQK